MIEKHESMIVAIYSRLREHGFTHVQAAGILGNMKQESNFNTRSLGFDGTGSYGLCQWLGPRKAALFAFAGKEGKSPADAICQVDFMVHEFKTSEQLAYRKIKAAITSEDAALAMSRYYERPAAKYAHNTKRVAYAETFAKDLRDEHPVA